MNDDATPSSAAGQPSTATPTNREDVGVAATTSQSPGGTPSAADSERLRKAGLAKKLQFTTHLMKSLDMVVFAEICTLYYME